MKAVVKYGQEDGQVELRDVLEPRIGSTDVLLEVKAAAVCGWDIEMWRHKIALPVTVPVIQGHEFCGVVREVGAEVSSFRPGDRVVSETAAEICGVCRECRSGNYNLCASRKGFGYGIDGAFTSLVRVPERCLHRIPDGVSYDHAALTEPVCVVYHALVPGGALRSGEPAVIIGPGPIGLFSLQLAKAAGACPLIMVGAPGDAKRMNLASKLGADAVIDVSAQPAPQIIQELTRGIGAPLVVDAAGNEKALELALTAVARRGTIVKIGWGPKPVNLSLDELLRKAARLQGAFSHNWATWEAVLRMIAFGLIDMEAMISHRLPLEDWHGAFQAVESREATKVVFIINRDGEDSK